MFPIIFLWAHPRSMSTAVERIMRERDDLHCLHEPFLHYYYLQKCGKNLAHFDADSNHPVSYQETRDSILDRAQLGPVFAKDMSYYVMPELLADEVFCRRVKHSFLIRSPIKSMLSYYKLDPEFTLEEVGIEAQWLLYEGLHNLGIEVLPIIDAESLQEDTAAIMAKYWQLLNLDYKASALHWDQSSTPGDWTYVKGWHQQVSQSLGIQTDNPLQNKNSQMEFDRLILQYPKFQTYLDYHTPAYSKLKSRCITK